MYAGEIKGGKVLVKHDQGDASMWLRGSSFPLGIPSGSLVAQLALEVPEGLQAISFFVRENYAGNKGHERMALVLFYDQGEKRVWIDIGRQGNSPTVEITAQFNPFILGRDGVAISNVEIKARYVDERTKTFAAPEPGWTVKTVSPDAILRYVCKQLTLEELDAEAESEWKAHNYIAGLESEVEAFRRTADALYAERDAANDRAESGERQWVALEKANYALLDLLNRANAQRLPPILWGARSAARAAIALIVERSFKKENAHETAEALIVATKQ